MSDTSTPLRSMSRSDTSQPFSAMASVTSFSVRSLAPVWWLSSALRTALATSSTTDSTFTVTVSLRFAMCHLIVRGIRPMRPVPNFNPYSTT